MTEKDFEARMEAYMEKYASQKYSEWSGLMADMNKKLDGVHSEISQIRERTLDREELETIRQLILGLNGAGLIGKLVKWVASILVAMGAIGASLAYLIRNI